jgi:CRP-like cAMP-binding protein
MPTQDISLFLKSLSDDNQKSLLSQSVHIPLPVRMVPYVAQETPSYAYFITSGLASVVTAMADGATAEVGIGVVGREGVIGRGILRTESASFVRGNILGTDLILNAFESGSRSLSLALSRRDFIVGSETPSDSASSLTDPS